jgi:hypothetical protein
MPQDDTFEDGGRHASGDIEAGEADAKATAVESISIVVHLH